MCGEDELYLENPILLCDYCCTGIHVDCQDHARPDDQVRRVEGGGSTVQARGAEVKVASGVKWCAQRPKALASPVDYKQYVCGLEPRVCSPGGEQGFRPLF